MTVTTDVTGAARSFRCDAATAVVRTDRGSVKGYVIDGVNVFKGIPYAKAKRFHAPEPVESWEGVFDASSFGYVCPLMTNDRPNGELFVPHRFWPMDEDCLNLNLWTPGLDDGKRPVLVWFHGGGFEAGSAIEHIAYEGANLAKFGDAVVVTVNHRLNILGYFDLSDFGEEYANSANAGNDDMVAALRWVHENIAGFGGDPENVTVFGQSGGGAKVTALLQTPAADGLYAKGMVMSGVIDMLNDARGSGRELAEAVMGELGIRTVKELEEIDYRLFARAYLKVKPALQKAGKYVGCCPKANAYYLGEPRAVGFRQETANIPLLIGSVFSEFFSFAPAPVDKSKLDGAAQEAAVRSLLGEYADGLIALFRKTYPERGVLDMMKLDFIFRAPEIDYIALRSQLNDCTYSYMFNMDQPLNGGTSPWHCSDIPYFFHNIDLVEYPHSADGKDPAPYRLQEQMSTALITFARTGAPGNNLLPAWPSCRPGQENTMVLDRDCEVRVNHDHTLMPAAIQVMGPVIARLMSGGDVSIQH